MNVTQRVVNGFVSMLKNRVKNRKKLGRRGFTLLELLVVVAILAAIAGTATIALKDTDMRASAAAHVTMMDELNKGIQTYRVLKRNELPSYFDSLLTTDNESFASAAEIAAAGSGGNMIPAGTGKYAQHSYYDFVIQESAAGFDGDAAIVVLPADVQEMLTGAGITNLQYVDKTIVYGSGTCEFPVNVIMDKNNDVVAGNVFLGADANGCGIAVPLDGTTTGLSAVFWTGGMERLSGQKQLDASGAAIAEFDGEPGNEDAGALALMLTGIGPSSNLFNQNELGGMTTVPVYRHVQPHQYNRFIAVWNVGEFDGSGAIIVGERDQPELVAIIDGALDTKEEELGEWDGTRSTI